MAHNIRTIVIAAELRQLIQAEVNNIKDIVSDGTEVKVGTPQRLVDEDEFGCNWIIFSISGNGICEAPVTSVIRNFQSKYNLD